MDWIIFSVFTLLVWYFLRRVKNDPSEPPGPLRLPVLGSVLQMAWQDKMPHLALSKLSQRYGDVMSFGLGVHNAVVISSYKLIREVSNSLDLIPRYPLPFIEDRNFGRYDLGIALSNSLEIKKYLVRKLTELGYRAKSNISPILQEEAAYLTQVIERDTDKVTGEWAWNQHLFGTSTMNCVWGFVAGFKWNRDDPMLLDAANATTAFMEAIGYNNVYVPFPFLKKMFPVWSGNQKHKKAYKTQYDVLRGMIKQFRQKRAQDKEQTSNTFVDCFLDDLDNGKEGFTEEQLLVTVTDLFVASDETTSTIMAWTLLYLSVFPDVQAKLHKDIVDTIGTDMPEVEHDIRLPYAKAVLYEVFRKVNFVPLSVPRSPEKDIVVNGYTIKKGTCLIFNTTRVHSDPQYWGDPENFRPERFLTIDNETGTLKLARTERVFGFGMGRRSCPGEAIAWNLLFMFLVSLIQKFEFSPLPGRELSLEPIILIHISPKPYSLKVTPRM